MSNTILTARIIDQSVQIINQPLLASGSVDVLQIRCEFDSLWDGYGKTAVFYRAENEVYHIPLVLNIATVPHEVLTEEGYFYFGVFGNKDNTRTTETVRLELKQGALTVSNADHGVPTPDIYQQLVQAYAQLDWQVAEDKARIDNIIKMHGDAGSDSIVFNLSDEYVAGTILFNGADAYLSATWDGMTLVQGGTHYTDYCIPPHLVPMIETPLEMQTTQDLVAYLEPAEEAGGWGRIRITNVADSAGVLNIQNEACAATYPLANLTIRELADLRVGYDGATYNTAGDALRGQIRALYAALGESGGGEGGGTGGITVMFVQPNPLVDNSASLHSGEICNHVMAGGLAVFLDNRTGDFEFYQLTAADPQRADFVKITNDSVLVIVSVFEDYHTEWKEYSLLNQEDVAAQVTAAVEEAVPAAVAEALTPHVNNKSNPHGVTAAQVGARPSTWTPTAAEVGARPSTWTPSFLTDKDQAGYRNGLQYSGTPTNPLYMAVWDMDESATGTQPNRRIRSINAEGARELIGAAPAGYGLGTTSKVKSIQSAADLDTIKTNGWYAIYAASGLAINGVSFTSVTLEVSMYNDNYGHQTLRHLGDNITFRRAMSGGTWKAWEFVGAGVEFDTAINVADGITWEYTGSASKFYVVTMQIGTTAYRHTFVVDWAAVNAASGKQIGYYSDANGSKLNLVASISGNKITLRPGGGSIVHIRGYY